MGTRSGIGRLNADGTVTAIYCHWDGYVSSVGDKLHEHYTDPAKVGALMALGSISSLGPEIGEQHPFDKPFDRGHEGLNEWRAAYGHMCNAYGRDRGEEGCEASTVENAEVYPEWVSNTCGGSYAYLFRDGQWFVHIAYRDEPGWQAIPDALAEEMAARDN